MLIFLLFDPNFVFHFYDCRHLLSINQQTLQSTLIHLAKSIFIVCFQLIHLNQLKCFHNVFATSNVFLLVIKTDQNKQFTSKFFVFYCMKNKLYFSHTLSYRICTGHYSLGPIYPQRTTIHQDLRIMGSIRTSRGSFRIRMLNQSRGAGFYRQ